MVGAQRLIFKNKVGKARRGRCDDCFRSMPVKKFFPFHSGDGLMVGAQRLILIVGIARRDG